MVITRTLYCRALGAVHLIALLSLWGQLDGLVGSEGILPFADWLSLLGEHLGLERYWKAPTLLWLWPSDLALHGLCALGVALAAALVAGAPVEGPLLLGLYVVYLSLCTAGQDFLSFQWDALLCEATFAAIWVGRFSPSNSEPPRWAWWLQWWVLARLMFFGGLVKLTSGDPTWADGSALTYHFWTQPLPNPMSWYADRVPDVLLTVGVILTFVVELVFPFLIPLGRRARLGAFTGFVALMGALAATGNYGFFQLLSVVLCLPLLDDGHWRAVLPEAVVDRLPAEPDGKGPHLGLPVAVGLFGLSLLWLPSYAGVSAPAARAVLSEVSGLQLANRYGLFAVMTTTRPELVLEGTWDGERWEELHTRAKPGLVDRRPTQVAPHMPRLDWQLWFAALGDCRRNPWVIALMHRVTEGSEPVADLFAPGAFDLGPPRAVRAVRWQYAFAPPGSDAWWIRSNPGLYCPIVGEPAG